MWTCFLNQDASGASLEALTDAFAERNPGCSLAWRPQSRGLTPGDDLCVAFVQEGEAHARVGAQGSELGPGDLILLGPDQGLELDAPLDLLSFQLPGERPEAPAFIRPDHDPRLGDRPGGCAEEREAYRRLLLTWAPEHGPYICRSLNAHRVRMWDSFSHSHPVGTGFEELYLVQDAAPGSRLFWSDQVATIERSSELEREEALPLPLAPR